MACLLLLLWASVKHDDRSIDDIMKLDFMYMKPTQSGPVLGFIIMCITFDIVMVSEFTLSPTFL